MIGAGKWVGLLTELASACLEMEYKFHFYD